MFDHHMNVIRLATPDEAPQLGEIAFDSKAYWGYSPEFMEECRNELTVDPEDCRKGSVVLAEVDGVVSGFYKISGEPPSGILEDLFVRPSRMGEGLGSELMTHAIDKAKSLGMAALEIHSDPNAVGFYEHMGAKQMGNVPSGSVPGRFLPKLILRLDK
jgi:GNAT superfamily N-acetyltransferase